MDNTQRPLMKGILMHRPLMNSVNCHDLEDVQCRVGSALGELSLGACSHVDQLSMSVSCEGDATCSEGPVSYDFHGVISRNNFEPFKTDWTPHPVFSLPPMESVEKGGS